MKKLLMILCCTLILAGCGAVETFETVGAVDHEQDAIAVMAQTSLSLPEDAAAEVFENGTDKLYLCEDYTIVTQILPAGDLDATVEALCGYERDALTIVESAADDTSRYDWVWTAASDDGDLICRAAVLDDGSYHYCLCAMAPANTVGQLTDVWNSLFSSFVLA